MAPGVSRDLETTESRRPGSRETPGDPATVGASMLVGGGLVGGGGTIIGALLIGVPSDGLVTMNVSPCYQQVIIGAIIILAVAFDTYAKTRRGRR